ncbi:MAG: hypothetical protein PSW75_02875 [bacterium]|nr:hypothetical protein [bacterium]MDI1337079.1 hypothetical protein [Lacunisphaera sp.]
MSYTLRPEVVSEAQRIFSPELTGIVLEKLAATQLPLDQGGPPPRVHIAVLWLSQGNLPKLEDALAVAATDWRDSLVAAGLAHANWRSILASKGIDTTHW